MPPAPTQTPLESGAPTAIVFAGGGSRCFWQAGFWSVARDGLGLAPDVVAGASAGATVACICLADRVEPTLGAFKEATSRNPKNVYPLRVLGREPVFPHLAMYRQAILGAFDDAALARLQGGPEVLVALTRPPAWAGVKRAALMGFALYTFEKKVRGPVHANYARRVGYRMEAVPVSRCRTPDELADLLLQSSCTPPMTPLMLREGRPVLDGGLVDSVPVEAVEAFAREVGRPLHTLVLLSRRYRSLPSHPRRTYVQPSRDVPVAKWDYTSPAGLQGAFDLGRRDADAFIASRRRA